MIQCPAILLSAPGSGHGKTTVTAALARHHRKLGQRVRVFKTGPDFIDPMVLEFASGHPVYQLDLWMGGEMHCRQLLYNAAREADLILIEGVMGLFDGESSSADLAAMFNIPVMAVIDGSAMAQTFGALAHGLATYRPKVQLAGVFANRVGSPRHFQMLRDSLPSHLRCLGWMPRDDELTLPERHLGLVQAAELDDMDERIERISAGLRDLHQSEYPAVTFREPAQIPLEPLLLDVRIAVARDAAFSFLYQANLDVLNQLGASIHFFSPMQDSELPDADALYLAGGYPELHMQQLSSNHSMIRSIKQFHAAGKPIIAECGGMLYLMDRINDINGNSTEMASVIPGQAHMQKRLARIGMHSVDLPEGLLRGHAFHYSTLETHLPPAQWTSSVVGAGEAVYRNQGLLATFMHFYFASNPLAVAELFAPAARHTQPAARPSTG